MTERAAHLVDHVFPDVPVRQWVLSLPYRLRYRLAWEGFSPNPPNGNCTSYSVETPPSFSNEAGVFDDNFYLPGNAPNPCTSTSTQGFYIDQYPIQTTYSVTWQYSGVSVQGP